MSLPPPPPAEYRDTPQQKPAKNAENYAQKQFLTGKEKTAKIPYRPYTGDGNMHRPAKWQQPKSKHTNRLHKRKQAKIRAKRNGR